MIETVLTYLFQANLVLLCIASVIGLYTLILNLCLHRWTTIMTAKYGIDNLRSAFQINKRGGFETLSAVMHIEDGKLEHRHKEKDEGTGY